MIPFHTTRITVKRVPVDVNRDAYDVAPEAVVIAQDVRAILSAPSGTETRNGGTQEVVTWHLDCDPVDLNHDDRVIDQTSGTEYAVTWAKRRHGLGLDRIEAGLLVTEGVAP